MVVSKTYKVIIPYNDSANPHKEFKIEYTVEAANRKYALEKAEREFNSYTGYSSASWTRTIKREGIRIWKLLAEMPQTPRRIDELAEKLSSEDEDIIYNSLKTLGEIEDSSASSKIIKVLGHKNLELVALAVETLGKVGDPTNFNVVKNLFTSDSNSKVKACIVTAIGRLALQDDNIIDFLTQALTDDDSRVRANSIETIGQLNLQNAGELLLPLLNDEDNRVKANVIKALWNKEEQEQLLDTLKDMSNSNNYWMRISAIFVLGKLNTPERLELLSSMTQDEHPKVRKSAREAIFKLNEVECIPKWLEMIETDQEFQLLIPQVIKMGKKAVAPLLSFSSNNKNGEKYAAMMLDIIEMQTLNSSKMSNWLKTKQKRIFKTL